MEVLLHSLIHNNRIAAKDPEYYETYRNIMWIATWAFNTFVAKSKSTNWMVHMLGQRYQGVLLSLVFTDAAGIRIPLTIIDTPGIRHFALWNIKPNEAIFYFPEMEPAALQCSFGLSCSHIHEDGCKILQALAAGAIHPDRYESWRSIRSELELLTAEDY